MLHVGHEVGLGHHFCCGWRQRVVQSESQHFPPRAVAVLHGKGAVRQDSQGLGRKRAGVVQDLLGKGYRGWQWVDLGEFE